jgi:hypothetical protein
LGKKLIGVETLSLHVIKLRESKTTYHTCTKARCGGIPTKCERRPKQHEESATNSKRKSHKKWVTQMERMINMTITRTMKITQITKT